MSSVRVENATKDYPLGRTTVPALRGVALAVERGEFITVAGPSAPGKSTLLNRIGCLDHTTSGRVPIDDRDVATLGDDALFDLRAEKITLREGTTLIFSTHDPPVMGRAPCVLRLADGRLEA
jgi:ABC-type lipoprotein export system ATPase subunit